MGKSTFYIQDIPFEPEGILDVGPPHAVYTNRATMVDVRDSDSGYWKLFQPQAMFVIKTRAVPEGITLCNHLTDYPEMVNRYGIMLDALDREMRNLRFEYGCVPRWRPLWRHTLRWKAKALPNRPELDAVFDELVKVTQDEVQRHRDKLDDWTRRRERRAQAKLAKAG